MAKSISSQKPVQVASPELRVTSYDRASSGLMVGLVGMVLMTGLLTVTWLMNRPVSEDKPVPIELIELPGGDPTGAIDETLLVESPEDPVPDAAPQEMPEDEIQIAEVFENITELAEVSTEQLLRQYETDAQSSGTPGSRTGTGRRALGDEGGDGGLAPEQRWFIQFDNQRDLASYARQLDFFGIELGVILPDGRLAYLSGLSQQQPSVRYTTSGREENRLYMSWQGGPLRQADRELFQRVGIDAPASRILHFYPAKTESLLLSLEQAYAKRKVSEIRRTYFQVVPAGEQYEFQVTRQSHFR